MISELLRVIRGGDLHSYLVLAHRLGIPLSERRALFEKLTGIDEEVPAPKEIVTGPDPYYHSGEPYFVGKIPVQGRPETYIYSTLISLDGVPVAAISEERPLFVWSLAIPRGQEIVYETMSIGMALLPELQRSWPHLDGTKVLFVNRSGVNPLRGTDLLRR